MSRICRLISLQIAELPREITTATLRDIVRRVAMAPPKRQCFATVRRGQDLSVRILCSEWKRRDRTCLRVERGLDLQVFLLKGVHKGIDSWKHT